MAGLVYIICIAALIFGVVLFWLMPKRRRMTLLIFAVSWTGFVAVLGYSFGMIVPTYRLANAAQIIRMSDRILSDGEYERLRIAFSEANLYLQNPGSTNEDAILLLCKRLNSPRWQPFASTQERFEVCLGVYDGQVRSRLEEALESTTA